MIIMSRVAILVLDYYINFNVPSGKPKKSIPAIITVSPVEYRLGH